MKILKQIAASLGLFIVLFVVWLIVAVVLIDRHKAGMLPSEVAGEVSSFSDAITKWIGAWYYALLPCLLILALLAVFTICKRRAKIVVQGG